MYMWLRNDKLDSIMKTSGLLDAIGTDNIMHVNAVKE